MAKRFAWLLPLAVCLSLMACDSSQKVSERQSQVSSRPPVPSETLPQSPGKSTPAEAPGSAPDRAASASEKDAYERQVQGQLSEVDQRMEQLRVQARSAGGDLKREYEKALDELDKKRDVVENRIKRLKETNVNAWEKEKPGMDSALNELKTSTDEAYARLQ